MTDIAKGLVRALEFEPKAGYHAYVEIVGTYSIRSINILKGEDERPCQRHSPIGFEGRSCVEGEGKADVVIGFVPTDLVQLRIDKH